MPLKVRLKISLIILIFIAIIATTFILSIMIHPAFILISVVLLITGLYLLYVYYPKFDPSGYTIYKLRGKGRCIALTFDDGPDPVTTPEILDILKTYSINAAFFCVGERAERYPEIIKRIREDGHILGNHGYSHTKLHNRSLKFIRDEIEKSERVLNPLTEINGYKLFRTPHGFKSLRLARDLKKRNYILVGWTRGIWDTDGSDANTLLKRAEAYLRDGVIYLLHDGRDIVGSSTNTVEFLRKFIPILHNRGYRIITITDTIEKKR
jgi:peptidoglycan/xylan/chitin deacetylase (PgdA/CDA1 family)